jgi:hypothetical protein
LAERSQSAVAAECAKAVRRERKLWFGLRCRSIGELRSHSTAKRRFNVPKTGLVALFIDQLADGRLALLVMQLTPQLSGRLELSGQIKQRRTVNIRSIRACKL